MIYTRTRFNHVSLSLLVVMFLLISTSLSADAISEAKQLARSEVDSISGQVAEMSARLWDFSEIALTEKQSAEYLADVLQEAGFELERGVAGMPTAFVGSWGEGHPVIGILAEYDALPDIGNAVLPERSPREDAHPHGQGCGHNLFGAGSVAAAIALKRTMEELDIPGTVKLFGSPAEETLVGKVYMANAGVFDGIDITLDWHPFTRSFVNNEGGQAMNNFEVEFFGQAAHGALDPWNGRSALDAVEVMTHAANMMREHVRPSARIHYVTTNGGEAPNVVPDYAKVWFYVRDHNRELVEQNYAWLLQIAEAAALATQTTHKVTLITGVHELLLNRPLQEAMQANLEAVGGPDFDEDDQSFGKALQEYVGKKPSGYNTEILPLADEVQPTTGGSTDVAEVTRLAPGASLYITTAAADLPWHSWATSASHGRPNAWRSASVAAKVLSMTALDFLLNEQLREQAKAEFDEKMAAQPYVSPIPKDQKPMLPVN